MFSEIETQFQELNNIFNCFGLPNVLSNNDTLELVESAHMLICETIQEDPMLYIKPKFHEIVFDTVHEILEQSMNEFYDEEVLHNIINKAFNTYYSKNNPARSYKSTFNRFNCEIAKMTKKIEYLKNIPQPEQRTKEWYEFRHNYLTASNIWKCFISESSRNQLIYEKCCPINTEKFKNISITSPLHWGQKYEPVSIHWYEYYYKTTITDYGCLPHETIPYLAASPDGINTCVNSQRYGRMLEIKNIWNREINGIPKMEYWIQMQVQMEVCKLNECDFLETRFVEYINKEAFLQDGTFQKSANGKYKGIIMYFIKDGMPHYEYAPFQATEKEFEKWEEEMMIQNEGLTWNSNLYWRLEEISCVLVVRNKLWFTAAQSKMDSLWETVLKERKTGYEHRAPKKRKIKASSEPVKAPVKAPVEAPVEALVEAPVETPVEAPTELRKSKRKNKTNEIIIQIDTEPHSSGDNLQIPKNEHD
jgi:putative phage-type endonuclease